MKDIDFNSTLDDEAIKITEIEKGKNNRIFKLETASGKTFVLKDYLGSEDRMEREFSALSFLKARGFNNIPKPLKEIADKDIAVYEFVEGKSKEANEITREDIDQFVDFAIALHEIDPGTVDQKFGLATGSALKLEDYLSNTDRRIDSLLQDIESGEVSPSVKKFAEDLDLHALKNKIREDAEHKFGKDYLNSELPPEKRRLSPADFGIHNAIFGENGKVTFVDFEYFGWDDPVKLLSDFVNHVGNRKLPPELLGYFISEYIRKANPTDEFIKRFEAARWLNSREWIANLISFMTKRKIDRQRLSIKDFDEVESVSKQVELIKDLLNKFGYN